MSTREGKLEAPTRHALDWQSEAFYDRDACHAEIERVFDICHGCRRCVSLCQSFPTLFGTPAKALQYPLGLLRFAYGMEWPSP